MKRYFFIALIVFLETASLLSQVEKITPENGLSNRDITCILQTKNGFMWFGTLNGLNRYDGYSIKEFNHHLGEKNSLSNGKIKSLYEDKNGFLWIGTDDGVNILNQHTGEIKSLLASGSQGERTNRRYSVSCMAGEKDGTILIGFYHGDLLRFKSSGEYETVYNNPEKSKETTLTFIYPFSDQEQWGIMDYSKTVKIKGGELKIITNPHKGSDQLLKISPLGKSDSIALLADDHSGITKFNINTGNIVNDIFLDSLNKIYKGLTAFSINENNEIWAGYNNDDILNINLNLHTVSEHGYYIKPFITGAPRRFYRDNTGVLWIGTNYGVIKYFPKENLFENYLSVPKYENIANKYSIRGMIEDDNGDVYIGGYRGLLKFNPALKTFKTLQFIDCYSKKSKDSYYTFRLVKDSDYIWVGSEACEFYRFNKRTEQFEFPAHDIPENFPKRHVTFAILDNNDRTLWLGTSNGLFIFDKVKTRLYKYENKNDLYDLSGMAIMDIIKDKDGSVWIGSQSNGLYKLVPGKGITEHFSTASNALSYNAVTALHSDAEHNLWIGTRGGGLNVINTQSGNKRVYTKMDGLADDVIAGIVEDNDGNLWISTFNGLSKLDKATREFHNYYEKDGLTDNEFNIAAHLKTKDGKVYMGGLNGVNAFYPAQLNKIKKQPAIYLSRLTRHYGINDSIIDVTNDMSELAHITLSYKDKFLSMNFALADYYNPTGNKFAYILEGFDNDWINIGSQNNLRLNNLAHGDYVLRIRGTNSEGIPSINEIKINIHVSQAFYKTGWFVLLGVLLVIALIYSIVKYRMNQQLKVQQLRTKISSDLHDEVGSLLTRVSIQAELVKQGMYPENESKQELEKIAETSRLATATMSDVLWSIDARNDKMGHLIDHMREHVSETLNGLAIEVDFKVNNIDLSKEIDTDIRQNLFLIFKEAINNIAKHSGAKNVFVKIENSNNFFTMSIKDDSKAIKINNGEYKRGQGLKNIEMRAKNIEATLNVSADNGYDVSLTMKLFC